MEIRAEEISQILKQQIKNYDARVAISETGTSIPTYNTPLTILPPRIARLSARFDF